MLTLRYSFPFLCNDQRQLGRQPGEEKCAKTCVSKKTKKSSVLCCFVLEKIQQEASESGEKNNSERVDTFHVHVENKTSNIII